MSKVFTTMMLIAMCLITLNACSDGTTSWREEAKLLDGRVVVVTQRRKFEHGTLVRDAWLTINLKELGDQPIIWHEALIPMLVNVYNEQLYVVGIPSTSREYDHYGRPEYSYIGFRYEKNRWNRIDFKEIPEQIYDANLLYSSDLPEDTSSHSILTLKQKQSMLEATKRRGNILTRFERVIPEPHNFFR